jgi:hypothetical protein
MNKRISCRKTRRAIQDALDRVQPGFMTERGDLSRFLPEKVREHLEGCPGCGDFLNALATFAPALHTQLEFALKDYTGPEVRAVIEGRTASQETIALQGKAAARPQAAALSGRRGGMIPSAFQKLRNWLLGPAGKPAPMYRLVSLSVLVAVLVCLGGVRIYVVSRTHRMIEQQIDRIVAGIYQEPLLPGIESALLRTQPGISDYMEDLNLSTEILDEDTGLESYLN